jgi:hypothetical protein
LFEYPPEFPGGGCAGEQANPRRKWAADAAIDAFVKDKRLRAIELVPRLLRTPKSVKLQPAITREDLQCHYYRQMWLEYS